jgi:REase_AHJR-like protein
MTPVQTKRRVLSLLRNSYEGDGFLFLEFPDKKLLPSFMQGYQPNAVALSEDRSVAIEVVLRGDPAKVKNLEVIGERFKAQPGWELHVVYGAEVRDEHLEVPTPEQIRSNIAEAEALLTQGHPRAALVIGWATIEAIARTLQPDLPASGPRTSRAALELLEHLGRLPFRQAQELRKLSPLRDKIVHGDFGATVTDAESEPVIKAARAALEAA